MTLAIGTHIGPYEIVGWLGAGGMGEVYRARDPRLARDVAIKLIAQTFSSDANRVSRFEQEARAAGQLNHPNILAMYDVGVHAGTAYIVSELLEGESLRSRLQGGALSARKAVDYARQIAEGLAAAHEKGIVHRDLKPDNLFIVGEGRIKILDFGLAKLVQSKDEANRQTVMATETEPGTVMGTVGYMSPEQVRGEVLDAGSDLFSFGTILHEMLTGQAPFSRATAAETMTAVLKEEPNEPLPKSVPPALERIVSRCLEKSRAARFQSARDLAFALEVLSGSTAAAPVTTPGATRRWRPALGVAVVVLSLLTAAAAWLTRGSAAEPIENLLTNAQFSKLTEWEGTEAEAEISPDGRFAAFLADRAGEWDIWLTQIGTGDFRNLTADFPSMGPPAGILRGFGFSGDGSEIWFSPTGDYGGAKVTMPLTGGATRAFLSTGAAAPAWSPDGARLVFFKNDSGDPLQTADRTGADANQIAVSQEGFFARGVHSHNPVWSPDGQWIYFVHGYPTTAMNIWRVKPAGGMAEQLTDLHVPLNYVAPFDMRTVLYVARTESHAGPWLWALDVDRKVARRISSGLEQYTSVSASRDGRRLVASVSNPTAGLWRVPIRDRGADERAVQPYPLPTARALAPRFGGGALFYLSTRGMGDGLWRYQNGRATEIGKVLEGALPEPPAVSRDGSRVAFVVSRNGKRRLVVMAADGTNVRTLTEAIDVQGPGGVGPADWSPDGAWIVVGGSNAQGAGLFKIPVDGGAPTRLVNGEATNPVWSSDGTLIVYGGTQVSGQTPLLGVKPDGTPVPLPDVRARINSGYRFTPDGSGLVYLPLIQPPDFWMLDIASKAKRQLTHLESRGALRTFDITPGGDEIVFERSNENSNIYLIDLPK
jgi:Tol biopolymer transport system component